MSRSELSHCTTTLSIHSLMWIVVVFGAPAMADNGQLICVLAGPGSAVKKVIPYCKGVMGRANINYSDRTCCLEQSLPLSEI